MTATDERTEDQRLRDERRARVQAGSSEMPPALPWRFYFPARPWQVEAVRAWVNAGYRGVIEAATGTGKTAVALLAIQHLHDVDGERLRVVVVVPTMVLARQWRNELETSLGIPSTWIGEQHTAPVIEFRQGHSILITVVNSARTRMKRVLQNWRERGFKPLLIVDECHRAGSEFNSKIFENDYEYAIGLSATPERDDGGHLEHVYPGLGDPVYRYPLLKALDDEVLAPVVSVNLYVDFTGDERVQWDGLRKKIGDGFRGLKRRHPDLEYARPDRLLKRVVQLANEGDLFALGITKSLSDRRILLATARDRRACQRAILEWVACGRRRVLVFHETVAAAEESHAFLRLLGVNAGLEHSKLEGAKREDAMNRFKKDLDQVLVAVRALDEGVDVPDASVAVIAAGSRTRRQRIQRFGRVLRRGDDKQALVITILVRETPEESCVGSRDAELLGESRVRHHRWPGLSVAEAVMAAKSTFAPTGPDYTLEDALTVPDVALAPRR